MKRHQQGLEQGLEQGRAEPTAIVATLKAEIAKYQEVLNDGV